MVESADHSSKKGRSTISKKELKMSLVAKRLSMLQDDRQITPVLSPEIPMLCESCSKPSEDVNDDSLLDDIVISKSSQNRMNHGSHKRAKVLSDDESSEDRDLIACVQPIKRGRPKKKVKSSDLSNDEDVKASDNPIVQRNIQRMDLTDPSSAGNKSPSMKRAEEVEANLSAEHPSFVKLMLKSHVSGGFWLGLPKKFCDDHLPICDSMVVLVDEAGKEFNTKYLAGKVGLSGGWRGFSIHHDLLEGDALIFHLIEPTKFKIYIIRAQSYGDVDGALGLLTLDYGVGQQNSAHTHLKTEDYTQKVLQAEDYTQNVLQAEDHAHEILQTEDHAHEVLQTEDQAHEVLQTEDDSPFAGHLSQSSSDVDLGPEVLDGIRFLDSDIKYEGIEDFENFNIIVDGLILDSKFSDSTRKKYYELCRSQGSFLHDHLLKGLNCNLVVGIISETINIADAINSCKNGFTSHEDLQIWEKTLKGFEFLGMKVAFLHARIIELQGLDFESKTTYESTRLKESITKRAFAGERMKALEDKLSQLKETMEKIDVEMEAEITKASAWKQKAKIEEIPALAS